MSAHWANISTNAVCLLFAGFRWSLAIQQTVPGSTVSAGLMPAWPDHAKLILYAQISNARSSAKAQAMPSMTGPLCQGQ